MKGVREFIIKQFASNPDGVVVTEIMDGETYVYNVVVSPDDMGVVIGREGKTINSIRNLAKAKAIKDNVMIRVLLEEPNVEPTSQEDAAN